MKQSHNHPHMPLPSTLTALLITLTFLLSLYHLGSLHVPSTSWQSTQKGTEIILDFGSPQSFAGFVYYLGNYENRVFHIETGTGTPVQWHDQGEARMERVYQWGAVHLEAECQYVKLTTEKVFTEIKELVFFGQNGQILSPVNSSDYPELFDEAELYPGCQSFQDGTIFDEPVFARTAYEYLHGLRSYEDTHPLLGKLLLTPGILLFGMNPFGWRFMGAVAGAGILVLLWLMARRLLKSPWTAFFVTALFAADFLRFTHTRLAQVDGFLVFFILGMYYFMLRYISSSPKLRWLALSGLCMGCAISCKWSGCYAAVGLAILWAAATIRALRKGRLTGREAARITAWCVVFFILLPLAVYTASYIPYVAVNPELSFTERVLANQVNMFRYHSGLTLEHPDASLWYQWPLIYKPILYYRITLGTVEETVLLLGNPVLWWGGLAAFFFCLYHVLEKRDGTAAFLLTAFLTPLVPWMLVPRSSFLYHYFPCLPFLALMLGLAAERLGKGGMLALGICAAGAVVLFGIFYPVLSGYPVPPGTLERLTAWLPWWRWLL